MNKEVKFRRVLVGTYHANPAKFIAQDRAIDVSSFGFDSAGTSHSVRLTDAGIMAARMHSISFNVVRTIEANATQITKAVKIIAKWMQSKAPVRILGAGRALLAGGMPGNRLAHAGARAKEKEEVRLPVSSS